MTGRRELLGALVACAAGAALTLFAAGRPWVDGQAAQGSLRAPLEVSGSSLAPIVPALALAALAGTLALIATRGLARRLAGLGILACGLGIAAAAAGAADPDAGTLAGRAGDALGTATAVASGGGTGWAWPAAAAGLLVAAAGGAAAWRGPAWPGMSARYDAPAAGPGGEAQPARRGAAQGPAGGAETAALDQWRALDRGDDPTS